MSARVKVGSLEIAAVLHDFIQQETILRALQAKGIPIALGSDTPQAFNIPGDSTVEEMIDRGLDAVAGRAAARH